MGTPSAKEEPERLQQSIVLIDDDSELCVMMREFFAEHEFNVEAAEDGRIGLARALSGNFELILLDVLMPQPQWPLRAIHRDDQAGMPREVYHFREAASGPSRYRVRRILQLASQPHGTGLLAACA